MITLFKPRNTAPRLPLGLLPAALLATLMCVPPWVISAEPIKALDRIEDLPATGTAEYEANCAVCHGEQMQGAAQGSPLVGQTLKHGDSIAELTQSIAEGFPNKGMPAWSNVFTDQQVKALALLVSENRAGYRVDMNINSELEIPDELFRSAKHDFVLEEITAGLDRLPYSISVLPDGAITVTEKMYGLHLVIPDGALSELIKGTPETGQDVFLMASDSLEFGTGWLLDVQAHPNYADNGWLYLHYTECGERCNQVASVDEPPLSRNVLVRGRIKDGQWVDQELIWQAPTFDANLYLDMVAGGRITFDPEGYVFITVGMRNMDGIQDLSTPYGKTHRLHDDGRIPADNPFVDDPEAGNSIWTYGHRSPQGLFFDPQTRQVWETEHGPRGGDEINLLLPGKNYGWPMFSSCQNYDGTEVAHGRQQSEVELKDTELPAVDWVPSPAISNLTVYRGEAFPQWQGQFLVGSLKAANLYRIQMEGNRSVAQELLVPNLARIRDIDVDANGLVYLLLEHASGGRIVRLRPADEPLIGAR